MHGIQSELDAAFCCAQAGRSDQQEINPVVHGLLDEGRSRIKQHIFLDEVTDPKVAVSSTFTATLLFTLHTMKNQFNL